MSRLVVTALALCLATAAAHRPNPRFPPYADELTLQRVKGEYRKVACTDAISREKAKIIEQSKCGEPKEVFIHLDPKYTHEQVSPRAVWVRRCVGLCEYEAAGACQPTETRIRHVPIRIYNAKTAKETCATFPVEEHVSCGCCALAPAGCGAPHVFNPRESEHEVEQV